MYGDETAVSNGVPQGSVLGPILYLLYLHSIKYAQLKAKYFMYADDTTLTYSGETMQESMGTLNIDLKITQMNG